MTSTPRQKTRSSSKHDHSRCISRALRSAEKVCKERDLQFTAIRRRVLELVWNEHSPVGAYEILASLKSGEAALAPPTVYRALEFLLDAGLIHRIHALNAFIGCEQPEQEHAAQFLVCRSCKKVTEIADPDVAKLLAKTAKRAGFSAANQCVEIEDVCDSCRNTTDA